MNADVFRSIFGNSVITETIISCSESQDDLGVVLRLHLVTENFLEAFISGTVNKKDMFSTVSKNDEKLRLSYSQKLCLAWKLGLPLPAFKALKKFNTLRNDLAHQIQTNFIDESIIESMTTHVMNIDGDTDYPLIEESAQFFSKDGDASPVYNLNSPTTPGRIKLMIVISALIRRTTLKYIT